MSAPVNHFLLSTDPAGPHPLPPPLRRLPTRPRRADRRQFSVPGLSAGCTRTFAGFVLGDLSSCLQVTALLPVISSGGNSSVVDSLNGYLTAFCSKDTPQCKNDSLTSAATSVRNGCQDELADPASLPNLFLTVLDNYTPVRGAACSKNET